MDESLQQFLQLWGDKTVNELKMRLAQSYTFAPGFNGDAYSNGRKGVYKGESMRGDAPKSPAGSALYNSIQGQVTSDGFQILMNSYWEYVNYGVYPNQNYDGKPTNPPRGGSSPFISSLQQWGQRKLGLDSKNSLGMAFAVRQNIFKFGIAGTGFFESALGTIEGQFETALDEQMGRSISEFFDKLFIPNNK
jgi:hypothetical protein